MQIAYGSVCELLSQTITASDLGYLDEATAQSTCKAMEEVRRMLAGLMSKLK